MKKKIRILLYMIATAAAITILANICFHKPSALNAIYGRWKVKDIINYRYIEELERWRCVSENLKISEQEIAASVRQITEKYENMVIEFNEKYFIEDGVQYNNPKYIYAILPGLYCIENSGRDIDRLKVHYEDKLDYEVDCLQVSVLGEDYVLNNDHLIMGQGGKAMLERISPRPWWQRLYSYIKATFSSRDPEELAPKELCGAWEIIDFKFDDTDNKYFTESRNNYAARIIGTKLIIDPKYLVINCDQYNNPAFYTLINWRSSDPYNRFYLDEYNGYRLNNNNFKFFSNFYIDEDGLLHFRHDYMDYTFRRLPDPSIWQRIKYYWNWLLDNDCSAKGFIKFQRRSIIRKKIHGKSPIDQNEYNKSEKKLQKTFTPQEYANLSKDQFDAITYINFFSDNASDLINLIKAMLHNPEKIKDEDFRFKFYKACFYASEIDGRVTDCILEKCLEKSEVFLGTPLSEKEIKDITDCMKKWYSLRKLIIKQIKNPKTGAIEYDVDSLW